jgi:hypothetical protein
MHGAKNIQLSDCLNIEFCTQLGKIVSQKYDMNWIAYSNMDFTVV